MFITTIQRHSFMFNKLMWFCLLTPGIELVCFEALDVLPSLYLRIGHEEEIFLPLWTETKSRALFVSYLDAEFSAKRCLFELWEVNLNPFSRYF